MIFSPLFVPKIKLNRSPGANLKSSWGTSGIESYLKSTPLGILNRILLFILPHEDKEQIISKNGGKKNFRLVQNQVFSNS